jgi:hypothetical protein
MRRTVQSIAVPISQRAGIRHQPQEARLGERLALNGFPEFMDQFLRFLHSFLVKRGTDQNYSASLAKMFGNALLRQEQREGCVGLDFFLEKLNDTAVRLIHGLPPTQKTWPFAKNIVARTHTRVLKAPEKQ